MLIVADAHVHLYPNFDLSLALSGGLARLKVLAARAGIASAAYCFFLTERSDCAEFRRLRDVSGAVPFPVTVVSPHLIRLRIENDDLWVYAGRQIVTDEGIEILALGCDVAIGDGLPAFQVCNRVRAAGALPVVGWAPGKWFFQRKKIVRRLIDEAEPGELGVCDTALRPIGWLTPGLLRRARNKRLVILSGSDPFPLENEEVRIGQYACVIELDSADTIPELPYRPQSVRSLGHRLSFPEVVSRILKLKRSGAKILDKEKGSAGVASS